MGSGKIIKKIKITELSKHDIYITLGKTYDVLETDEDGRASFNNDAGNWDFVKEWQYDIVEEEKSLVGRYLKALCDEPNESGYYEGDYIKIDEDREDEDVVCCKEGYLFDRSNWKGSNVELMPEGFEPSEDMAINIYMEQELKFRDEFQKELNEIDDEEGEAVCNIFKKTTEEDFQKLCDTLNAPIDEQQFKDNVDIFNKTTSNKPPQYNIGIDTFERMRANATYEEAMGFIRWNIDKYNTRQKGQDEDDYKKIISYAQEALWWIKNK